MLRQLWRALPNKQRVAGAPPRRNNGLLKQHGSAAVVSQPPLVRLFEAVVQIYGLQCLCKATGTSHPCDGHRATSNIEACSLGVLLGSSGGSGSGLRVAKDNLGINNGASRGRK